MLKPTDPSEEPASRREAERPVGELVHQLVEDGKAYARAEIDVAKAIVTAKGKALVLPAGLIFAAMLVAQSAVTALAVAVFFALTLVMNPIFAGLLAFLLFGGLAGGLAWYAWQRVRDEL
ncbi:MAG TPA: phage holin family protein [Sphingomicrobium sp.]|jgi:hypothetical protein|nr:phage holin family protein [Sphingomicrobium sp.]